MDYVIIRFLCSFLAGGLLSQAGSFIQLGTKNILASPSTLGFDGLAILWLLVSHSLFLFLGREASLPWLLGPGLPVFISIGFIFARMMVKKKKTERIILLGLTFNLLVGAVFSLWQFFFLAFNLPFPVELWFGHFRFVTVHSLIILGLTVLGLGVGLRLVWKELLLYSLGEEIAHNLRLDEKRIFRFLFSAVAVGTFIVVGLFGAFSFLGLVFPIVSRRILFKHFDLKGELVWGPIMNGFVFAGIDYLCYSQPIYGTEIPVGLIATVVGAVCLILILWNSGQELLAKPEK